MRRKLRLLPPSQTLACLSTHGVGDRGWGVGHTPHGRQQCMTRRGRLGCLVTLPIILNKKPQSLNTAQPGNQLHRETCWREPSCSKPYQARQGWKRTGQGCSGTSFKAAAATLAAEAHRGLLEHPAYLPNACLLEELIPGHVEIHACPLSLGEEEEAVRNAGAFERE